MLKIVGFAKKSTRRPLAERFYKKEPIQETYISGEDIFRYFEKYYDTEQLCRVIDAGMEEMWCLHRYEGTDELEEETRGWIGEMILSIEDLDGVFHTSYNTSSPFACWLSCLEWENLEWENDD